LQTPLALFEAQTFEIFSVATRSLISISVKALSPSVLFSRVRICIAMVRR
jgi:hypothetical protein